LSYNFLYWFKARARRGRAPPLRLSGRSTSRRPQPKRAEIELLKRCSEKGFGP